MKNNLKAIFNPKSVALIGASSEKDSVGRGIFENLLKGNKQRKIFPVNPFHKKILGIPAFSSILDIKDKIDLAIVAVKSEIVPKIIKDCLKKNVNGIIVISAGFSETGKKGKLLEDEIKKEIKKSNTPLLGPNVLGIINPYSNLNASFSSIFPKEGNIALISQSGALIDSILDRSILENYGFSAVISVGNELILEVTDFIEYLENDKNTKVIALYIESIKDGQRFIRIAKRVTKKKPILAIKAGKTEMAKKAISTHTGSLAGDYEIFKAAFKKTGVFEVETIQEMLDVAKVLSWQRKTKNGTVIITNGGGCGVMMTDFCEKFQIKLPKLKAKTIKKIEKSKLIHPAWSKQNPIDIIGDASPKAYEIALKSAFEQNDIYNAILIETLQNVTKPLENAKAIVKISKKFPKKAIVTSFLGGKYTKEGIDFLEKNKIPNLSNLKTAALSIKGLVN